MKKLLILIILSIVSFQCFGQSRNKFIPGEYTAEQCPKCGNTHIKITQKNFNGWAALGGAALLGPLGLVAGAINMGDAKFICTKCGFDFDHKDISDWNYCLEKGYMHSDTKYTPQELKQIRENGKSNTSLP